MALRFGMLDPPDVARIELSGALEKPSPSFSPSQEGSLLLASAVLAG